VVSDALYRRMFRETPRQRQIRHNWPLLCWRMTKAERAAHVSELRAHAKNLRSKGDRVSAESIEKAADEFERMYPSKGRIRKWR
jgi:hypothetical protein